MLYVYTSGYTRYIIYTLGYTHYVIYTPGYLLLIPSIDLEHCWQGFDFFYNSRYVGIY